MTGLGRFHDVSPALQSNRFRAALPSAGLSSFTRISVGLSDIQSASPARPTFYLGLQETVPDVGFIQRGLTSPGSSTLLSPFTTPPRATTPLPTVDLSAVPIPTDRRLDVQANQERFGLIQQQPLYEASSVFGRDTSLESPFSSAADSSIFGMPRPFLPTSRDEPFAARPFDVNAEDRGSSASTTAGGVNTPGLTTGLPAPGEADAAGAPPEAPLVGSLGPGLTQTPLAAEEQAQPGVAAGAPAGWGLDRFTDLLGAVRTAEDQGVQDLSFTLSTGQAEEPGAVAPGDETSPKPDEVVAMLLRRRSMEGLDDLSAAAKWASDTLEDPVTSFAGANRDRVNRYLAAGEEALRRGAYYRAADQFELAHTADPENPLPLLHRGHALIAAGDYVSGSLCLQQGIERFPQIAAFRIDLPAMFGDPGILDIRRADLEKKLEVTDHYTLRFLLGYLELYSGLPGDGLRNLQRAAEMAPAGSTIATFSDLLVGRRPMTQPPEGSAAAG
jgi:hypothetical protein